MKTLARLLLRKRQKSRLLLADIHGKAALCKEETDMLSVIILFAIGLLLIMFGGDRFVDASVDIAGKLGIPQLVVGATIVSLGTTLPEILVSTTATLGGSPDIAAGNAFGSIICNTALIAAIGQLVRPTKHADTKAFNWRMLLFLGFALFLWAVARTCGGFDRVTGVILILGFVLYAYLSIKRNDGTGEEEQGTSEGGIIRPLLTLIICAALLFVGADLLVDNGILLARALHVPERVIGVTFIALGTSLPELVTAVNALIKGYEDVSLGNIIGANLINLLLVIGIPSAIRGIAVTPEVAGLDIPLGILLMLILTVPIFVRKKGYRWQGLLLLAIYAAYCAVQF